MAGATRAYNLRVINGHHRRKYTCVVTVFTQIGRLHVGRVFSSRLRAVVTAETVIDNVHVIEYRRQPANGCVAIVAGVRTRDVGRVFADGGNAIVARATAADDLSVIDGEWRSPDRWAMTVLTNVRRLNVSWALACCFYAVMTADTISDNSHVPEIGRHPANGRMTIITRVTTGNVAYVLASCTNTIVTTDTVAYNTIVIEHGG
jgi:hypothetical protein